jgi:hypothetical protein
MVDGASGFQVITSEVRSAAGVFARQAAELEASGSRMPRGGPPTGDAVLNETFSAVLDALGFLEQALGARAGDHSGKLGQAAGTYDQSEQQILARLAALRP